MALGMIGLVDLSIVTDSLVRQLEKARDTSPIWNGGAPPFTIDINGAAPESMRGDNGGTCVLSVYLLHVTANSHMRNTPLRHHNAPASPLTVPPIPFQPLGLDLYYLLTAWAGKNHVQEQQAMSVAIKWFHENPIIRKAVTIGSSVAEDFTVTLESRSMDDLGQLWQAVNVAPRLAAMYRVGVVFLTPPATAPPAPPPRTVGLTVGQRAHLPLLLGSRNSVTFESPSGPQARQLSPAVAAAGESVTISGIALDEQTAERVFLVESGTELDVTAWRTPATNDDPATFVLTLPAAFGVPPANTPAPGVYQVRVGNAEYRSNTTPFSVAARVTPPASNEGPFLEPVNSVFTVAGIGFVRTKTELSVGAKQLAEVNAAPNEGELMIVANGTSIDFKLPANMPAGTHEVVVRVSGVQSTPAWWVVVT